MFIVELFKRSFNNQCFVEILKRKKAIRFFEEHKSEIISKIVKNSIRYGNKSNMGFRYGDNKILETSKGSKIKQYAVDFNGVRELVKEV